MTFNISFSNLQEADTGDTTYYGGTIEINGVSHQAHGSDRGSEIYYIIAESIAKSLGRELTQEEEEIIDCGYEIYDDVSVITL